MTTDKETASKKAKELGFNNLKQVQEISGRTQQYLCDCFNNRPDYFEVLLHGCLWKLSTET